MSGDPHEAVRCETDPFVLDGEEQIVEVIDDWQNYWQHVRRCRWPSREVIDEVTCPMSDRGSSIEEIAAAASGDWLATTRLTGQSESGYDVFRMRPLVRLAGHEHEYGYILDVPVFSPDESCLVGAAGPDFLGDWWSHRDDDAEEPARGGPVSLGFLFVHQLPGHEVTHHELRIDLPPGWCPHESSGEWWGPRELAVSSGGLRMMPSWGVPIEVPWPLPPVIELPVPHPSGHGLEAAGLP